MIPSRGPLRQWTHRLNTISRPANSRRGLHSTPCRAQTQPPHPPNEIPVARTPKPEAQRPVAETEPIDIPSLAWYRRPLVPVKSFLSWFHRTQQKRPLTVQLATSTCVYFCGDLLAQEIGGEDYDPKRTLRMLLIGSISSIPGYKWSALLNSACRKDAADSLSGSSSSATTSTTLLPSCARSSPKSLCNRWSLRLYSIHTSSACKQS